MKLRIACMKCLAVWERKFLHQQELSDQ